MQANHYGGQRMRCMMCGRLIGSDSIYDALWSDDLLCSSCRSQWQRKDICFRLDGVKLRSSYVYNKAFSSCLIQYKECGDEALKDVFLHQVLRQFRMRYRGRVLLMMPSAEDKIRQRGFSHLKEMFECTGMEIMEPFAKTEYGSQKSRNRADRLSMQRHIVLEKPVKSGLKLLLCDDTVTTGATLRGALSCLKNISDDIEIYTVSANHRWIA